MSTIEFDEPQKESYSDFNNTPKITELVIKYSRGLINDTKQAQYFLLVLSVVVVISSYFILMNSFNAPNKPPRGLEGDYIEEVIVLN